MKKIIAILLVLAMILIVIPPLLTGCSERQASRVDHNISLAADNFNVTRRLAVINARTDEPIFELVGNFSLDNNAAGELEIIVEVGEGVYKKHFVYLNEWTIYVVEDVSGAYVDKYHYEVNFLPEMFLPVTFISED